MTRGSASRRATEALCAPGRCPCREALAAGEGLSIGVDEVGRGCLAGPVMAASVSAGLSCWDSEWFHDLRDSKTLTASQRARLARAVEEFAVFGLGASSRVEIDRDNIRRASLRAMGRALTQLARRVDTHAACAFDSAALIRVDGRDLVPFVFLGARSCVFWGSVRQEALIGGDRRCRLVAAASVVAKHWRDALMAKLSRRYAQYGWERNAGYGVSRHKEALLRFGITAHHRRSFEPVRQSQRLHAPQSLNKAHDRA